MSKHMLPNLLTLYHIDTHVYCLFPYTMVYCKVPPVTFSRRAASWRPVLPWYANDNYANIGLVD